MMIMALTWHCSPLAPLYTLLVKIGMATYKYNLMYYCKDPVVLVSRCQPHLAHLRL
jgi:hypothetical protein